MVNHSTYFPSSLYVRSHDSDRTVATAAAIGDALYPLETYPAKMNQFIMHSCPVPVDTLLASRMNDFCGPKEADFGHDWRHSVGKDILAKNRPLIDTASSFCGFNLSSLKMHDQMKAIKIVADALVFDHVQGFPATPGADAVRMQLWELSWTLIHGQLLGNQIQANLALGDLVSDFQSGPGENFTIYTVHREMFYTMADFLPQFVNPIDPSLHPTGEVSPGTAAIFEFHDSYIRWDWLVPNADGTDFKIVSGPSEIPWETWNQKIEQRIAEYGDWRSICGDSTGPKLTGLRSFRNRVDPDEY